MCDGCSAVGKRIREMRLRTGITQESLAEKCGVNTSYIGQIERGERRPSLKTISMIADALGTDASMLLATTETPESAALQHLVDTVAGCSVHVINTVTKLAEVIVAAYHEQNENAGQTTGESEQSDPSQES